MPVVTTMVAERPINVVLPGSEASSIPPEMPVIVSNVSQALAPLQDTPTSVAVQNLPLAMLVAGRQAEIAKRADELFNRMRANPLVVMTFDRGVLAEINAIVDQMLRAEPAGLVHITAAVNELSQQMNKLRAKYDVTDPAVRARIAEPDPGKFARALGRKPLAEQMEDDMQELLACLAQTCAALTDKQFVLVRNAALYRQLGMSNEEKVTKLAFAIAILEEIQRRALQQDATPEIAQLQTMLMQKITDAKTRLLIGWATTPQLALVQAQSYALAASIDRLLTTTIPVAKLTVDSWRKLIEQEGAKALGQKTRESTDRYLQLNAAAQASLAPIVASSSLDPVTLSALASSLATQADAVAQAAASSTQADQAAIASMSERRQLLMSEQVDPTVADHSRQLNLS